LSGFPAPIVNDKELPAESRNYHNSLI